MVDMPPSVQINEEGPREGFQIEQAPIATGRKLETYRFEVLGETMLPLPGGELIEAFIDTEVAVCEGR